MDLINRQTAIYAIMNTFAKCLARDKAIEAINGVPAADTDISTYSDKLWRLAYEGGKDEAVRWIPVSERLPEALQEVLVTSTHGYVYTSRIVHGDFEYGGNVLAWMPLPEPYKDGD